MIDDQGHDGGFAQTESIERVENPAQLCVDIRNTSEVPVAQALLIFLRERSAFYLIGVSADFVGALSGQGWTAIGQRFAANPPAVIATAGLYREMVRLKPVSGLDKKRGLRCSDSCFYRVLGAVEFQFSVVEKIFHDEIE